MKTQLLTIVLLITYTTHSQVGIGTTNPTAELEINTLNSSLPPLELNPQTAPLGTAAGQLSVIDDQLYLFDANRNKWLSVGTSTFNFGREGGLDGHDLEYAGDILLSGPSLLENGTIVYLTLNSSGGKQDKGITLNIYNYSGVVVSTHNFNMINGRLMLSNLNIDFSKGDYFRVSVDNDTGPNVKTENVSAVIWTKWRKNN